MGKMDKGELEPLHQEAVDWVHRLASGGATLADAEALNLWLLQSPAHAAAYAEASRVWKDFGPAARSMRQRGEISPGLAYAPSPRDTSRRAVLGGFALAVPAAAYGIVWPPFELWPSLAELKADYRTQTGQQTQVALLGNFSVRLNTQTSLALRSSAGEVDRVELVTGEASFAAPQTSRRSIEVLAASGSTSASDAHFNIRRIDNAVSVTCLAGDIQVAVKTKAIALGPGQQVSYDNENFGGVIAIDPELVTAWQEGALIFRMTPLAEVVEEINRYRPGRVILLNAELARKPVSGRFQIDHMDEILVRLNQAFGAKSRFLPGGIVLVT